MNDNIIALATIFGMAAVTYFTRVTGFYLSDRLAHIPPVLDRLLKYLPGTIIVSIIAPQILDNGTPGILAALACIVTAVLLKNLVAVMVIGVITMSVLRHYAV